MLKEGCKNQLIHELQEDNFDRKCDDDDPIYFLRSILFSNEAAFYLNGIVNPQNCRYST